MNLLDIRFHVDILRQSFKPCSTCGSTIDYICSQTTIDPTSKRWKFTAECTICGNSKRDILMKPILGVL